MTSRTMMRQACVIGAAAVLTLGQAGRAAEDKGLDSAKELAKVSVHNAALGLGGLFAGITNAAERVALTRAFITPIRFYADGSGYFYVYDGQCVNIAHATQKEKEGQNLFDYKDVKGLFVIRELLAAAKKGGGFVEYFWQEPGKTGEHRKLGYVEPIPNTDWFIGSGVYLPE